MTSLLSRYLNGEILRAHFLMTGVLVALFSVFSYINELDEVGGDYSVRDALVVVALAAPSLIIDLAPFAVMLGSIYGLSVFARHHELVALRAAGQSPLWITGRSLLATVLFIIALIGLETIARPLSKDAMTFRTLQTEPDGELLSRSGFWYRAGDTVVNVASLRRGTWPAGVRIFEFDGTTLRRQVFAPSASQLTNGQWRLNDAIENRFLADGQLQQTTAGRQWQPPWSDDSQLHQLPLISLSIDELDAVADSRDGAAATLARSELWKRLLLPLTCLGFALFAAPFALAHSVRGSQGLRLSIGVLAMLLLYVGQQVVTNTALLAGIAPPMAALAPTLIITGLALTALAYLR